MPSLLQLSEMLQSVKQRRSSLPASRSTRKCKSHNTNKTKTKFSRKNVSRSGQEQNFLNPGKYVQVSTRK